MTAAPINYGYRKTESAARTVLRQNVHAKRGKGEACAKDNHFDLKFLPLNADCQFELKIGVVEGKWQASIKLCGEIDAKRVSTDQGWPIAFWAHHTLQSQAVDGLRW